jgi:hypothetical protein
MEPEPDRGAGCTHKGRITITVTACHSHYPADPMPTQGRGHGTRPDSLSQNKLAQILVLAEGFEFVSDVRGVDVDVAALHVGGFEA